MQYTSWAASGQIRVLEEYLNFVVADIDITAQTTALTFIRRLENELKRELGQTEKARKFLTDTWSFIKKFEAAGVSYSDGSSEVDEVAIDDFAYSLAQTVNRITAASGDYELVSSKKDGLLILIDEADNASDELSLGSLLKLLMERLARQGCRNVMLLVAGLPEVKPKLLKSHPSSLRIFDDVILGRLGTEDIKTVVSMCLEEAKRDNRVEYTIDPGAMALFVALAEGYPHFIQQFGHCAFQVDRDCMISEEDVRIGAFGKGGALEQIGERYYRDDFYNKIQKDSYRQVLRIMAERLDDWISKDEIKNKYTGKASILDNAIKALRDRHIIMSKEGGRGIYRLQHKGFALWIRLYTNAGKQMPLLTGIEDEGDLSSNEAQDDLTL